jgi:acetolactate synthase I/II/III large subunit
MMIRVADFIFSYLNERYGIEDVFMISGGGAIHLNDALGRNNKIRFICNHHEQASAIAAEGYSRIAAKLAVVVVTTGPGGTNTLTGLIGQWLDSVPVLYISGQIKYETSIASCPEIGLRQLGDQEINIVDIVKPVTKYASMVTDPLKIKRELDIAIYKSTTGRKGPVWLDIPLNVQGAYVNENELESYEGSSDESFFDKEKALEQINNIAGLIAKSKRPLFLAGNGLRGANSIDQFIDLINTIGIPVVTSFLGCDIIETDSPLSMGRIGTIGNRGGNFVLQNADLLISIGSRNNIRQTSYNWKWFARGAIKIVVDIDKSELNKPTFKPDIPIHCDALFFINNLSTELSKHDLPDFSSWVKWGQERKNKYPSYLKEYADLKKFVHPYYFTQKLTAILKENDIVVTANATPSIVYHQLGQIKNGQRVLWNSGCAAMGYGLPAAIGAAFGAQNNQNVICLEGDGSLQMNIQELQTLVHHQLPIKLFVLDNRSYISIKQTQTNLFEGKFVGSDLASGVSFPDFSKVAIAYGLKTFVIDNHHELDSLLSEVLETPGPVVCHVKLTSNYIFSPKTSSKKLSDGTMVSAPLEDMFPFLDREEFLGNMIIKPIEND